MPRKSAANAKPLSDAGVRALAQSGRPGDFLDGATPGLFLRVGRRGAAWSLQYRVTGHGGESGAGHARKGPLRRMHLGDYPATSLRGARTEALRIQELAGAGVDPRRPSDAKATASSAQTLDWLVERYIEDYAAPRLASAKIGSWVLRRHWTPEFGARAFSSLTRSELNAQLQKVARSKDHGAGAALEARRWIMGVFSWAIKSEIAAQNPAVGLLGRDDLRQSPKDLRPRERVLTLQEARAVYHATPRMPAPWGELARVLLLTLARLGEFSKAEHVWLDRDGRNLEIPGAAHKNGDPKSIPLSGLAFELLEKRPYGEAGPYFFSTTDGAKPIYSFADAYADTLRALAAKELKRPLAHFTLHDFRRTGATHLTAMGVREDVVEMLLGHRIRGVRGVYMKHKFLDERRDALELWAAQLTDAASH